MKLIWGFPIGIHPQFFFGRLQGDFPWVVFTNWNLQLCGRPIGSQFFSPFKSGISYKNLDICGASATSLLHCFTQKNMRLMIEQWFLRNFAPQCRALFAQEQCPLKGCNRFRKKGQPEQRLVILTRSSAEVQNFSENTSDISWQLQPNHCFQAMVR